MNDDGKFAIYLGIAQGLAGFLAYLEGMGIVSLLMGIFCGAFIAAGFEQRQKYKDYWDERR